MNLKDFIITNAKVAGLSDNEIGGIMQSAMRKLPGNVPEDKYEEQIMEWINIRVKNKQKSNPRENKPDELEK